MPRPQYLTLILTDNPRRDSVSWGAMPRVQALAERGVTSTTAQCASPRCMTLVNPQRLQRVRVAVKGVRGE